MQTQLPVISKLDFPGIHPQRFSGGRKHMAPEGTIQKAFEAGNVIEKGRKHYSFDPTPLIRYKPGIKVWAERSNKSQINLVNETEYAKKLVFLPPPKNIFKGIHGLKMQQTTSVRPKMSQRQKELFEQLEDDKKAVGELDNWEQVQYKKYYY